MCVCDLCGLTVWCVRVPFVFRLRDGGFRAVVIRCLRNGDHPAPICGSGDGQDGMGHGWRYLFSFSDDFVERLVKCRAHRGRVGAEAEMVMEGTGTLEGGSALQSTWKHKLRQKVLHILA